MPAWDDQAEAETTQGFKPSCCEGAAGANKLSAQPCGCDPGCKPKPHVCEQHRPAINPFWQNQRPTGVQVLDREQLQAMADAFNRCAKGTSSNINPTSEAYPQDRINASSVLGDTCPRCGGQLEHSEGLERDYPDCPRCRG